MAGKLDFVEFVVEQMQSAGVITYRPMFGAYTVYCDAKEKKEKVQKKVG